MNLPSSVCAPNTSSNFGVHLALGFATCYRCNTNFFSNGQPALTLCYLLSNVRVLRCIQHFTAQRELVSRSVTGVTKTEFREWSTGVDLLFIFFAVKIFACHHASSSSVSNRRWLREVLPPLSSSSQEPKHPRGHGRQARGKGASARSARPRGRTRGWLLGETPRTCRRLPSHFVSTA